jgi:hypothetical protein
MADPRIVVSCRCDCMYMYSRATASIAFKCLMSNRTLLNLIRSQRAVLCSQSDSNDLHVYLRCRITNSSLHCNHVHMCSNEILLVLHTCICIFRFTCMWCAHACVSHNSISRDSWRVRVGVKRKSIKSSNQSHRSSRCRMWEEVYASWHDKLVRAVSPRCWS